MRAKLSILLACAAVMAIAGCSSSETEDMGTSVGVTPTFRTDVASGTVPASGEEGGGGTFSPLQHYGADKDRWYCQDTDEACELYCAEGEQCGLWKASPTCLAECRGRELFRIHPNLAHACIVEEECSFYEDTAPCVKRKQDASTYECAGAAIKVCDEEGCCFLRSCAHACADHGLASNGCGHSDERGHDACRCEAD